MTRSFANCSAEGGTIDSPGGGRFLDIDPVDLPNGLVISDGFCPSGPSPLAVRLIAALRALRGACVDFGRPKEPDKFGPRPKVT